MSETESTPTPESTPEPSADAEVHPELNPRRLVIRTLVALVVFLGALAGAAWVFREPLLAISTQFVDAWGGPGIFLGVMLPDAFTVPFPPDLTLALGALGGMSFGTIVIWASAGSLTGGTIAFFIGRTLRKTRGFQRLMARAGGEIDQLTKRYGSWALGIAAMTPVPYSLACYATGAGAMPYTRFIIVSLLRIPRIALYLWLIELGIVSGV